MKNGQSTKQTKTPRLNVRLLRRIQKHILAEPRRFVMGNFVNHGEPGTSVLIDDERTTFPSCGTAACIAGWACLLTDTKPRGRFSWGSAARKVLRLSNLQACDLFSTTFWPNKYGSDFYRAKTVRGRVNAAVRRIDHLIKTGE